MITKKLILGSIKPAVESSRSVKIDENQIKPFCQKILKAPLPATEDDFPKLAPQKLVQYCFFIDSLNFCFWPPKGGEKWHYLHKGEWLSGYYAFTNAATDACLGDSNFLTAEYLATIPESSFNQIFAGRGELQLLKERWQIIQQNFQILNDKFKGQTANLIEEANFDANKIIDLLLIHFPSFADVSETGGQKIYFLKRAQIFISDLVNALGDQKLGQIKNLNDLTIFADYKLPQLLQAEGILKYSDKLTETISNRDLIPQNSREEIEIRAATVWACELIITELNNLGRPFLPTDLDWLLWIVAKQTNFTLPYHHTVTTFY